MNITKRPVRITQQTKTNWRLSTSGLTLMLTNIMNTLLVQLNTFARVYRYFEHGKQQQQNFICTFYILLKYFRYCCYCWWWYLVSILSSYVHWFQVSTLFSYPASHMDVFLYIRSSEWSLSFWFWFRYFYIFLNSLIEIFKKYLIFYFHHSLAHL